MSQAATRASLEEGLEVLGCLSGKFPGHDLHQDVSYCDWLPETPVLLDKGEQFITTCA